MGWLFLVLGAPFALVNWGALIESYTRKKHISMVPPLGGVALPAGAAILGWRWWILLALADPCVISILTLPPYLVVRAVREWRATRPPRLPRASLRTRDRRPPP